MAQQSPSTPTVADTPAPLLDPPGPLPEPELTGNPVVRRVRGAAHAVAIWVRERKRARATKKRTGSSGMTTVLVLTLVTLFTLFGWALFFLAPESPGKKLTLDEVRLLAEQGRVETFIIRNEDDQATGRFVSQAEAVKRTGTDGKPLPAPNVGTRVPQDSPANMPENQGEYHVSLPSGGALTASLEQAVRSSGGRTDTDLQSSKEKVRTVTTFLLPLVILANLFALLFSLGKGGGSAIGDVINFGQIGKGKTKKGQSIISFEDVGGADEAVAELREVRDYLTDPAKYEALGAAPPKGVLLFGPPGCGKTLLAKAVAGEAGVPFFSVAGAQFVEALVGVGAARVRDLFERVRAAAPAIVFIDELDAAGRKRGTGGGGGGADEREQTLNQILVEMDGFEVSSGIVVIGATNRPDILDPALMRPGRFDRHITIERPDHEGRARILAIHAKGKPLSPKVDLDKVAERTPGFTGADLANVVNEAALLTIRQGKAVIEPEEIEEAILRVLQGTKRRGRVMTTEERMRSAYHESGHVVVAAAAGKASEVHRVSILSRGRAVATTTLQSDSDPSLLSKTQLHAQLVTLLAGIASEELIFGESSTGGEQDLEQATDLARDIVARYGMSPKLGPVRLLGKASDGFLGDDIPLAQDLAPETRALLDSEIRRLIAEGQAEATALLSRHRKTLDGLATLLDERETLEGDELQEVLAPIEAEMASEHLSDRPVRRAANGSRTRRTPAKTGTARHR
jgi:cell division protease FtsH